jgi:hypothetical protein
MKVNPFLILLVTFSRLIPTASVVCRLIADDFENELVSFNCRNRPDFNLLGGPGCQFTCLAKNSTCSELDGNEVCGKFRFRGGFYAFGKTVAEFCLIPDGGFLAGRFGRYCVTFRVCLLQGGLCGCRVVADGRRCRCRIETVDGEPTPVSNCPFYTNDPSQPERSAAGFFPSESEFEEEMSLIVDDDGLQYNIEEAYSAFLHLFGSKK